MSHFYTKIPLKTGPCLMQPRHMLTRANLLGGVHMSGHKGTSKFVPISCNKTEPGGFFVYLI